MQHRWGAREILEADPLHDPEADDEARSLPRIFPPNGSRWLKNATRYAPQLQFSPNNKVGWLMNGELYLTEYQHVQKFWS